MQYLALLYAPEDERFDPADPAFDDDVAGYERFAEQAGKAIVGGEALAPSAEAVTIRYRPEGAVIAEGPFTEASEVVGGVVVLESDDLDGALELARQIPAAEYGAVELRPTAEQWFQRDRPVRAGARRYLALLAGVETAADQPGTPEWDAAVQEHARFAAEAGEAIVGGCALQPSHTATTVLVRAGRTLVTEGPFTEATEVVGGLYLLEAGSSEQAVDLASRIPMGSPGLVEVRPILELGG